MEKSRGKLLKQQAQPLKESPIYQIRSGGQTGSDRAALDTALKHGIPITGWCPAGGYAEDMTEPPGLLAKYPQLKPTESAEVSFRTRFNVRDSHATLIITPDELKDSPGTLLTAQHAEKLGRPLLIVNPNDAVSPTAEWIKSLGLGLTLNVAGPRESESAGLYESACKFLDELFSIL